MMPVEPTPQADFPPDLARRLPEWRDKHGSDLFYLKNYRTVLRPFTRGELIRFEANSKVDPVGAQIGLLQRCIVHPDWAEFADHISLSQFHAIFAGLWKISGFRDPENFQADLDRMRMLVLEKDHTIIRTICTVFPAYKPTDVDKMSRNEILYLLAQAEVARGATFDGQDMEKVYEALQRKVIMESKGKGKQPPPRKGRFFNWRKDREEQARELEE